MILPSCYELSLSILIVYLHTFARIVSDWLPLHYGDPSVCFFSKNISSVNL